MMVIPWPWLVMEGLRRQLLSEHLVYWGDPLTELSMHVAAKWLASTQEFAN